MTSEGEAKYGGLTLFFAGFGSFHSQPLDAAMRLHLKVKQPRYGRN